MIKLAIFGAGGLGRETCASLHEFNCGIKENWEFVGFYDDTKPIGFDVMNNFKNLGGLADLNEIDYPLALVICIGYPRDKYHVVRSIKNPLISYPNLIHKDFYIGDDKSFEIGAGNIIQWGCRVTTNTTIGNFNLLNGEIKFGHDDSIGDFNVFMNGTRVSGNVSIGDRNLFGTQSYVMEKVKVGSDVVVGPLSALLTKPGNGNTYIGNPAKKFIF